MSDTTATTKYRTITLTGRAPVKISETDWPVIAHGRFQAWDGEFQFQAARTTDLDIYVRQHADGRALVYGVYATTSRHQGERDTTLRVGRLLDAGEDLPAAILGVAKELEYACGSDRAQDVARECIADLPPVAI